MSRSSHKRFKRQVRKTADAYVLAFGLHEPFGQRGHYLPGEFEFHLAAFKLLNVDARAQAGVQKYFREMRAVLRKIEYPEVNGRISAFAKHPNAKAFATGDASRFYSVQRFHENVIPGVR